MQPRVVERHFLDLRKTYRSVLAVDLVNKVIFAHLGVPMMDFQPDYIMLFLDHCKYTNSLT